MKGLSAVSKKAVIATMVISLVLLFGSMTAPLLSYIGRSAAYQTENIYLILQVPAFVGMIVSFAVGPLAMKINLKWLMVACAISALIYFLIFALVGSNGPFIVLLIGAAIVGICQGAAMVLTSSIFGAYVLDPDQRANFVAISGALLNGGAAVVNVVGGIIASGNDGANWPNAYWLGLLIIPCLIIYWIMMPKAPDPVDAPTGAPGEGDMPAGPPPATGFIPLKVWLIIAMGTIIFLGMAPFLMNVGLYIEGELGAPVDLGGLGFGYTSVQAGLANSLFTILGVLAGFSFPFVVRFLKSFIAPIGYAIAAVGLYFVFAFQSNITLIFIGAGMCGFGFNIAMPYVMGQMMAITPPRWIPVAMSINMGVMNLGMTFAPNIMGAIGSMIPASITEGRVAAQLFAGVFFIIAGIVIAIFLLILWKNKAPEGAPQE